jgi:undecaprenyl-diphosphatase
VARYLAAWLRSIRRRSIASADERLAWALVVGTIPGAVAGALFENVIEDTLGQPWLIAVMLIAFGVILVWVDRAAPIRRGIAELSVRDGVVLGVAQAVALQPGVSRSGVTITAGRARGLDRESAARFSFLLSLPIIAGAGIIKGIDVAGSGLPAGLAWPFVWGILASAASGFLVIAFLLAYLRRHSFVVFLVYRIAVAIVVFVVISSDVRPASGL